MGWKKIKIYKLRSLKKVNFDKTLQVTKDDKRLLKIGKFIRRYSVDELPQFFNVLNGDMSIVGPGLIWLSIIHYSTLFSNFLKDINAIRFDWLGSSKWIERGNPKPEIMEKRMVMLWYLNNWTIWLLYIILKTFYALVKYKELTYKI